MKRSLITGASGQAGSFLCEHLLSLDREVFAMVRRNTSFVVEKSWLKDCVANKNFHICKGDVTDPFSIEQVFEDTHPHECYHAAAQSDVGESWRYPLHTIDATAKGTIHVLEVIRKVCPSCRFVQFSSSEIFGMARETPQNEQTPFYPRSPYGIAKVFAHHMTVNYRESYDLFACNAILFNMESPRRGPTFVTQKIAQGVARIATALEIDDNIPVLKLGNLEAKRDWNDVRTSVRTVVKMLENSEPSDYVIGSGETHSVREFLEMALNAAEVDDWRRHGDDYFSGDHELIVTVDKEFKRPAEVPLLCANPDKAVLELGYRPFEQDFKALVTEMVQAAMPKVNELLPA